MRFFIVLSCLLLVNALPATENATSPDEETGSSVDFADETKTDENDEVTKNSSELDFVPVSLQHPLFKVFGINPDEYVVYYKYNRNQDKNLPLNMKLTENDLMGKNEVVNPDWKKLQKMKFDRHYRQTLGSEEDENTFDLRENSKEGSSGIKKRSYFLPQGYPTPQPYCCPYSQVPPVYNPYPQQYGNVHPCPVCGHNPYHHQHHHHQVAHHHQFPHHHHHHQQFPHPPGSYPADTLPCPQIPTCKQCVYPHPFKFAEHPETYKQLSGASLSSLSYPDEPRPGTPRAKRSYYKKFVH